MVAMASASLICCALLSASLLCSATTIYASEIIDGSSVADIIDGDDNASKLKEYLGYGSSYDYSDGPLGPANWGNLRYEWRLCRDGRSQSPVALYEHGAYPNRTIGMTTYYEVAIVEMNTNHGLELDWKIGGGSLSWNGEGPYKVVNMHWHTPSEHALNGLIYPLECHIVHEGPNKELLVVGLLYNYGPRDAFLSSVMEWYESSGNPRNVRLNNIKTDYFNYMGSLTTPPCTEGVTWIVRDQIYSASIDQVNFISAVNKGPNARPLQPLNGRRIHKFQQWFIASE